MSVHLCEYARLIPELAQHGRSYLLHTSRGMVANGMIQALSISLHGDELKLPITLMGGERSRYLGLAYSALVFFVQEQSSRVPNRASSALFFLWACMVHRRP